MFVLFPGRHHLFTRSQWRHLAAIVEGVETDLDGAALSGASPAALSGKASSGDEAKIVVAITSANHSNTRRNPCPSDLRAAQAHLAAHYAGLDAVTVLVRDVGPTDRFASHIIASVSADEALVDSQGAPVELGPDNCVVASSTPAVAAQFAALGFRIFGLELDQSQLGHGATLADRLAACPTDVAFVDSRPWELVEAVAAANGDLTSHVVGDLIHPASARVWAAHGLGHRVRSLFADPIVSADSDLTSGRNYAVYMASFDRGAERKWELLQPHVVPGRVVDIGCATGSILALAGADPRLAESDLFGIELSRSLYDECQHRHRMGVFANPNTFFHHRNAIDQLFPPRSVNTTLTVSLTHEIESYLDADALDAMARHIFDQTAPGGVWLNYDVCAPAEPDRKVRLTLDDNNGVSAVVAAAVAHDDLDDAALAAWLDTLSTRARFDVFASTFRHDEGEAPDTLGTVERLADGSLLMRFGDAMDFLAHHTYVDSWRSEMHERFCYRSLDAWQVALRDAGFDVDPASRTWTNPWLVTNRFEPVASLRDPATGEPLPWGATNVLLVARRPV